MLFQHWALRITVATLDRGAFCSAGPDFFSTTSPQPMMPHITSFGESLALCISARGSRGTSARQPARKARWVILGLALTINLTINYCDLVIADESGRSVLLVLRVRVQSRASGQ